MGGKGRPWQPTDMSFTAYVLKDVGIQDLRMMNSTSASRPATAPLACEAQRAKGPEGKELTKVRYLQQRETSICGENLCIMKDLLLSVLRG